MGHVHTSEYVTHIKESPLLVKSFKCFPILSTHGYWTVKFFSVPHLLWHVTSVYYDHLRGPVTQTYCRVFRSNAVTTCLNDLCLSRPGFEHQHFACEMKTLTKGAQTSTDIHIYYVTSYIQLRVLAYLIYNQEH